MFDSYIKREEKKNCHQLLRINFAIIAFQFQEYLFGMQDRTRLIRTQLAYNDQGFEKVILKLSRILKYAYKNNKSIMLIKKTMDL